MDEPRRDAAVPTLEHTSSHATGCPLGPIELAIVRSLAQGKTGKSSMREAGLSPNSAGRVLGRMFAKAEAANATNLVAIALRSGWIR